MLAASMVESAFTPFRGVDAQILLEALTPFIVEGNARLYEHNVSPPCYFRQVRY